MDDSTWIEPAPSSKRVSADASDASAASALRATGAHMLDARRAERSEVGSRDLIRSPRSPQPSRRSRARRERCCVALAWAAAGASFARWPRGPTDWTAAVDVGRPPAMMDVSALRAGYGYSAPSFNAYDRLPGGQIRRPRRSSPGASFHWQPTLIALLKVVVPVALLSVRRCALRWP